MTWSSHIGTRIFATLVVAAFGCGERDEDTKQAHGFRRVELAVTDGLDAEVARHARDARALGFVTVVHIQTPWNFGGSLERNIDDPSVAAALEGIYLIEIAYDGRCLDERTCKSAWASSDVLCFTYGQTFHAVGEQGERVGPAGSPSKNGPQDAQGNAAMIRDYRALLEKARPDEPSRCAPIRSTAG